MNLFSCDLLERFDEEESMDHWAMLHAHMLRRRS